MAVNSISPATFWLNVGSKTIAKLLREFGSLERVREASEEDLAKIVGPAAARRPREFYAPRAAPEIKVLN